MTATDLRADIERLTNEAFEFEKKFNGAEMPPEDMETFTGLCNDLAAKLEAQIQIESSHGTLEKSKAYLAGIGTDPEILSQGDANKTVVFNSLADAFVASEGYQDFTRQFADSSGAISDSFRGTSGKFDVGGSLISASQQGRGVGGMRADLIHTGQYGPDGPLIAEPTTLGGVWDEAPLPIPYLIDLCTRIPVSGEGFKFQRIVSRTNNAGIVAESTSIADFDFAAGDQTAANGYKPESGFGWDVGSGTVETIAHWIPITRQAAADAPQVVTFLRAFLLSGLRSAIDEQIANGDGNAPNFRGLLNTVNPYPGMLSVSVAGGNRFNAILAAMAAIRSARPGEFMPDTLVINSQDFYGTEFLGALDANQNWQFGGPMMSPANMRPWGLRTVVTDEIPAGTQLLGDFRYALIADRQSAQIFFADQHKDFFVRNLLVFLAEQRLGFAVLAEQAFAQITARPTVVQDHGYKVSTVGDASKKKPPAEAEG